MGEFRRAVGGGAGRRRRYKGDEVRDGVDPDSVIQPAPVALRDLRRPALP